MIYIVRTTTVKTIEVVNMMDMSKTLTTSQNLSKFMGHGVQRTAHISVMACHDMAGGLVIEVNKKEKKLLMINKTNCSL